MHLFEASARGFEQHLGIALGREHANGYVRRVAVAMFQFQCKALHAAIAAGKIRRKIARHAFQRKHQGGDVFHFVRQFDAPVDRIGRHVQVQACRRVAQQTIDGVQQLGAETPLQAVAWHAQQLAQAADAHARQGIHRLLRQMALLQGHRVECALHGFLREHGLPIAYACKHVCGMRRGRGGDAMAEAKLGEIAAQVALDLRPLTQQAAAAADFQHDGVRQQGHLRAVAVGDTGEKTLPAIGFRTVVGNGFELRQQGLCGRQALADVQTRGLRRSVRGDYAACIRRAIHQHQRHVIGAAAEDTVQCQVRQCYAGPQHGRSPSPLFISPKRRASSSPCLQGEVGRG